MRSYFLHSTFIISDFIFNTFKFLEDKMSRINLKFRGVFNGHLFIYFNSTTHKGKHKFKIEKHLWVR